MFGVAQIPWMISGCSDGGELDGLSAGRTGRVSAVVEGDQIEIEGGETVRLVGVEAPRSGRPYAEEADAALARLVNSRRIELLFGGARIDAFGRTLAHLRTVEARAWVQGALLDQGAARVRTFADNRALAAVMLAREARARAARRGLWALADYRVRLPDEVEPSESGLVVIEGRVVKVGRLTDGAIYLDFGSDYRSSPSAHIPRTALADFRAAGVDPLDLQGRVIRVRGVLRGWRLVLDHPEALERIRS